MNKITEDYYKICPEKLPAGFIKFVEKLIRDDKTLTFSRGKKHGTCFSCGADADLPRGYKFYNGMTFDCPACLTRVTCVPEHSGGSLYSRFVDRVTYMTKGRDGGVWFRVFLILRDYKRAYSPIEKYLIETDRFFISNSAPKRWMFAIKNINFSQNLTYRLIEPRLASKCEMTDGCILYSKNIKTVTAGTALQYADLANAAKKYNDPINYAIDFARYPVIEFFHKSGYHKIVAEKLNRAECGGVCGINWRGKSLERCLKFPPKYLKALPPRDWDMYEIDRMTQFWEVKELSERERILCFQLHVPIEDCLKYDLKTLEYIARQKKTDKNVSWHIYRDYLDECRQLELDLTDKRISRPKNLIEAHSRTSDLVRLKREKIDAEKFAARRAELEKYALVAENLLIRVPEKAEELVIEGAQLKHCVAGYAKRFANGETAILFVRRADKPDEPFYTLELLGGKINQCRTRNNVSYKTDPAVKAFVEQWYNQKVKGGRKK
ncbi:hypothetical protein FACS1894208_01410 [Clostridia bacterium]|nr:hypothetical protein FACS1894208_01410 [Clostridia bacterium]